MLTAVLLCSVVSRGEPSLSSNADRARRHQVGSARGQGDNRQTSRQETVANNLSTGLAAQLCALYDQRLVFSTESVGE